MITLKAEKREGNAGQSAAKIREAGFLPAVCYGPNKESIALSVPLMDFAKVFKEAGETSTISLDFGSEKMPVIVHDMQRDPVTDTPTHVDFYIVDMKKELEVKVPIEFTGLAEAEKGGLGNVMKVLHEIEVKALPDKIPHAITVDVTSLATLEDKIHVSDIAVPAGVTVVTPGEEVVALVAAFVEEKEETTPVDLSAIEVEKKGKQEEEGSGEEAAS